MADVGESTGATVPGVIFQRNSSGLVRTASWYDTLIYNIQFTAPGLGAALLLLYWPVLYPGINQYLSLGIGIVLGLFTVVVFSFLSASMPRSGGDYVWNSRVLHPVLGVMTSVGFSATFIVFSAFQGQLLATVGLAPLFRSIGLSQQSQAMLDISNWFTTQTGGFVTGAVSATIIISIFAFGSLRAWFRVQNAIFAVGMLALAVVIVELLVISQSDFRSGIDSALAWQTGKSDGHDSILRSAEESGFVYGSFDLRMTLLGLTWVFASYPFACSSWIAGDVRRAQSVQLWTPIVAVVSSALLAFIVIGLLDLLGVMRFIGAAGFVAGGPFGSAPTFAELASYSTPFFLTVVVGIGFALWPLVVTPNLFLTASRSLLAYSIDGIVPRKLSEMNPRTNTPLWNLGFVLACSLFALFLYQYTDVLSLLAFGLVFVFSFFVTSVTAIVLPFRRPDIFEGAPAIVRRKVLGLPLISIIGAVSATFQLLMLWVLTNDGNSGIGHDTRIILINVGFMLAGMVLYLVAKSYWRSRGEQIDHNFRDLPVE